MPTQVRWRLAAVGVLLSLIAGFVLWWFDLGHADVEKLPRLHGRSLAAVLDELGLPDTRYLFPMSECHGEFRIELLNTYPFNDPRLKDVLILELQWHHWRYHVAVWLQRVRGQWLVLDTCRWKAGVVF
jgi:hypothetical protein